MCPGKLCCKIYVTFKFKVIDMGGGEGGGEEGGEGDERGKERGERKDREENREGMGRVAKSRVVGEVRWKEGERMGRVDKKELAEKGWEGVTSREGVRERGKENWARRERRKNEDGERAREKE